jgi:hypothetical protein
MMHQDLDKAPTEGPQGPFYSSVLKFFHIERQGLVVYVGRHHFHRHLSKGLEYGIRWLVLNRTKLNHVYEQSPTIVDAMDVRSRLKSFLKEFPEFLKATHSQSVQYV